MARPVRRQREALAAAIEPGDLLNQDEEDRLLVRWESSRRRQRVGVTYLKFVKYLLFCRLMY